MIIIKSASDIENMRRAGRITAEALALVGRSVRPGISTWELDKIAREYILSQNARPSFLNYGGFTGSICASINEVVIHGIPSHDRIIKDGDIISIDVGAEYNGFHGDSARTFLTQGASQEARKLVEVTRQSFFEGIRQARPGKRVSDISHAIQEYCESFGYSLVREYTGHGVGRALHEDPAVPNYGAAGRGPRLIKGMTLAIEPMVNMGTHRVVLAKDGWTVTTEDRKLSAHYENSILITDGEPEILTVCE